MIKIKSSKSNKKLIKKAKLHKVYSKGIFEDNNSFKQYLNFLEETYFLNISDINSSRIFLGAIILYGTGLRVNELLFLTKVNLKLLLNGKIVPLNIPTKTNKSDIHGCRDIVLSKSYIKFLKQYEHKITYFMSIIFDKHKNYSLLWNNINDKSLDKIYVIKLYNKSLRSFSLNENYKSISPYNGKIILYTTHSAFRHSFIQRLHKNGVDLDSISKLVGHASSNTTRLYNKRNLSHKELLDNINKI